MTREATGIKWHVANGKAAGDVAMTVDTAAAGNDTSEVTDVQDASASAE